MQSFESGIFHNESNLGLDAHELERIYLFQDTTPKYVEHRVQELKQQYPNERHGRLDFLLGAKRYERARELHEKYLAHAFEHLGDPQKPVSRITPEEFYASASTFGEITDLQRAKDSTQEALGDSVKNYWKGEYVDKYDAMAYLLDLEAQTAQRIPDTKVREREIERTEGLMLREVIPSVENPGKKFEYIFITFVRRLIREAGMDHVIGIHHGLPIEDMVGKTDIVLLFGDTAYDIQMKGYAQDEYRREYHEDLIHRTKQKIADTQTKLLMIDPSMLRDCYAALCAEQPTSSQKRKLTTAGKNIISLLSELMDPKDAAQFVEAFNRQESDSKEKQNGKKLTDKFLLAHQPPDALIALGLLTKEDRQSIPKILEAKKRFMELVPQIKQAFVTEETYLRMDPESVTKFEQATGIMPARMED